jgi:hypothetical protein
VSEGFNEPIHFDLRRKPGNQEKRFGRREGWKK